ncbi:RTA1 like protein-domain-containing protein [Massariosphaeria phaeospora]|uniref:RTA1 like protein-domain-containing protein n=1 Tax=Massariosphaeria phaeospora TaxID=100035 RepID=A0A7C8MSC1_9PLEO|nr:RTA1 like protein-domain-containing protein [Massariosphaeria phaeospora]
MVSSTQRRKKYDWEMFRYIPSLIGAIISLVIFAILALLYSWQWIKARNHIVILAILTAICEVGGYGARIGSHYDNKAWAPFLVQGTLLLVGPLFLAATIYMMLGRTIRLAGGEDISIIKPMWYTRIFVGADVATFGIQGLGSGIMGTMKLHLALAGEKIVIAGLALQVATFMAFLVAAADFHIRMNRHNEASVPQWKKMLWILYAVSSLVLLRCVFRLVEYAMGNTKYLISHEWTLFVFDTVPMVLALAIMLILQPSKYVATRIEKTEENDSQLGAKV